jgi:hypothetical protein
LPHHLQTTGVGWLVAALVLVVLSVLVFAGGLQGLAVDITVVDAAVLRWLAGLQAPGLLAAMQALAALGSYVAITVLLWGLLLAPAGAAAPAAAAGRAGGLDPPRVPHPSTCWPRWCSARGRSG